MTAKQEAEVDGATFHWLRHYYASLFIRFGEAVKTVQATSVTRQRQTRWTPTATCGQSPTTEPDRRHRPRCGS